MSSKAGSSIGAFLLSLPVSAMLLMMVFGVPRFSPGTNGATGWEQAREWIGSWQGGASPGADSDPRHGDPAAGVRRSEQDPFAGVARSPDAGEAPRWDDADRARGAPASGRDFNDARDAPDRSWPFGDGDGDDRRADRGDRPPDGRDSSPPAGPFGQRTGSAGGPLTWTAARRRLTELGIQEFHLEPGLERDQFLFVCMFTPGDDSRVTQRFEAEAADPLTAVQDVLAQIDGWLAQRYADRSRQQWNPPDAGR